MKTVYIYTDGACSGNPGPGGWGSILKFGNAYKELSGADILTTNNKMELTAVIMALRALKEPCDVDIYSDSNYVVEAFNQGWIDSWVTNGWKTASRKEVKNVDLWQKLLAYIAVHKVNFIKVKGHSDNELNNRCDELARNAIPD